MKIISLPAKITVFSLLCLLTLLAHHTVERYREVGEQLLQNNAFAEGLKAWGVKAAETGMVTIDKGQIQLHSTDAGGSISLFQSLKSPLSGRKLSFKATVKTENIIAGPKGWDRGRVLLLQYQQGRPQYTVAHVLTSLQGTNDWTEYRATFLIQPGTTEVRAIVQLSRCTGELYCRDMSLYQLVQHPFYGVVQWAIMAAWLCFAMVLFRPVLSSACRRGWWKPTLTVFAIMGIIVGTTLPGTLKNELKDELIQETKSYAKTLSGSDVATSPKDMAQEYSIDKATLDITKVAHFGLFGLLTFLLLWQNVHSKPLLILVDMLMLACATELLQLFVEGRGALPLDVVIDMAGSATGLLIWRRWREGVV